MSGAPDQEMHEPRRHLMAAREDCLKWLKHLRRSLQGLPQSPPAERARLELHSAVMTYYDQLRRFRSTERLQEPWVEEGIGNNWTTTTTTVTEAPEDSEEQMMQQTVEVPMTLERLGRQRLNVERRRERVTDPDTNATTTEVVEDAWALSRHQALAVIDQLDICAQKLGFDIQPSREADVTGAGQGNSDTPDTAEMEHLNENPRQRGANGD